MQPQVDFGSLAELARSGPDRMFVCVCTDSTMVQVGMTAVEAQWPIIARGPTVRVSLAGLSDLVGSDTGLLDGLAGAAILVPDAWQSPNPIALARTWAHLNVRRDALLDVLVRHDAVLILFVTENAVREVASDQNAADLLALVQFVTADDESPAAALMDENLVERHRKLIAAMEAKYQRSTAEFVKQLLRRQPDDIAADDQVRWSNAVSLLRKVPV